MVKLESPKIFNLLTTNQGHNNICKYIYIYLQYIIPALIHISHQRKLSRGDGPIVLVLSPTRELAQQIQTVCEDFGDAFGVSSTCLFGGAPKGGQVCLNKLFSIPII